MVCLLNAIFIDDGLSFVATLTVITFTKFGISVSRYYLEARSQSAITFLDG